MIPKQLRQTLVDLLHLRHPGQGGKLEAAKNVCYPYLHRHIVATAQNCKECRQKSKNQKVISGNTHFTPSDAAVELNEEIQLDFLGPLPDENFKHVYILVGVYRFSRFSSAKVVTNNKADTIIRFMQTHIVNHGSHETYGVIRHKVFWRKKLCCIVKIITSNIYLHRLTIIDPSVW